jgi:hypothetical protein
MVQSTTTAYVGGRGWGGGGGKGGRGETREEGHKDKNYITARQRDFKFFRYLC